MDLLKAKKTKKKNSWKHELFIIFFIDEKVARAKKKRSKMSRNQSKNLFCLSKSILKTIFEFCLKFNHLWYALFGESPI